MRCTLLGLVLFVLLTVGSAQGKEEPSELAHPFAGSYSDKQGEALSLCQSVISSRPISVVQGEYEILVSSERVRIRNGAQWLSLRGQAVQRGSITRLLQTPCVRIMQHRAVLDYGFAEEWFEVRSSGVEHGFTLRERLPGTGPVVVVVGFGEPIRLSDMGSSGVQAEHGSLLYSDLFAFDATDTRLSTTMLLGTGAPRSTEVRLSVDDSRAMYPVTIDPIVMSRSISVEANDGSVGDLFAASLGLTQRWVVAGAPGHHENRGAAYVYSWDGKAEAVTHVAKLEGRLARPGDRFGSAVAIHDNMLLVAAPGALEGAGQVTVFSYNARFDDWEFVGILSAPDESTRGFGTSVALSADTLAVGTSGDETRLGAVYVFERDDSLQRWVLFGSVGQGSNVHGSFGEAVALAGDSLLVGVPRGSEGGEVIVFGRAANGGDWTELQRIRPPSRSVSDLFGTALSATADRVLVGAPGSLRSEEVAHSFAVDGAAGRWTRESLLRPGEFSSPPVGDSLALCEHVAYLPASPNGTVPRFEWARGAWAQSSGAFAGSSSGIRPVACAENLLAVGDPFKNSQRGAIVVLRIGAENGDPRDDSALCFSGIVADGFCCDVVCDEPCSRCDVPGTLGTCGVAPLGTPGRACGAYACNGSDPFCPSECSGDSFCVNPFVCMGQQCGNKLALGTACDESRLCASGHCVDGVCCGEACQGSCQWCTSWGECIVVQRGEVGRPSCSPYVCDGRSEQCPAACENANVCARGFGCVSYSCVGLLEPGAKCRQADECQTNYCVDDVCCSKSTCGAYRCRENGACAEQCASTRECQTGYECSSGGRCEAIQAVATTSDARCGCRSVGQASSGDTFGWFITLVSAVVWRLRKNIR